MIPTRINRNTNKEILRRKLNKETTSQVIDRLIDNEFVPIINETIDFDEYKEKTITIDLSDETYERLIRRQFIEFKTPSLSETINELIRKKTQ